MRKLPADARLTQLSGTWVMQGRQFESIFGPAARINARETFEWLEGHHFMIHQVNGQVDDHLMGCVEVIGTERINSFYDDGRKIIWASSFEEQTWIISGWRIHEHTPIQVRCTTHFADDRHRHAVWELSTDGISWQQFWEVAAWKVKDGV
ncbi:MAG: hypothetical protein ABI599_11605 [Flavobacteriales bacterium]